MTLNSNLNGNIYGFSFMGIYIYQLQSITAIQSEIKMLKSTIFIFGSSDSSSVGDALNIPLSPQPKHAEEPSDVPVLLIECAKSAWAELVDLGEYRLPQPRF